MGLDRLATLLSRYIWRGMLWFMRRPIMKHLRRSSWERLRSPHRERVRDSVLRQDRFARRYGLSILRWILNGVLAVLMVGATLWIALRLFETGALTAPDELRRRAIDERPR